MQKVNLLKKFILSIMASTAITHAFAWTFYLKNMSPSELRDQGNIYTQNNLYSKFNNSNPYSTFQSVYDPRSARNNFNVYSAHVTTYQGQFQGNISHQVPDPLSITNPYGPHGRVFNIGHPSQPYTPHKWNNPYSAFQNPYNVKGARNNSQYGVQYGDSEGNYIGATNRRAYHSNSVIIPYSNSPFNPRNVANPYGRNKRFY